ncbi:MAG: hypothetical protein OEU92_03405 [Alphaproteobacteria bacterium]|nr:hypothetical protein [Alphaproteobacteria bacterium]
MAEDVTYKQIRDSGIYAYKINRLLNALEVYMRIYGHYGHEKLNKPKGLDDRMRVINRLSSEIDLCSIDEPDSGYSDASIPEDLRPITRSIIGSINTVGAQCLWEIGNFQDPADFMTLHNELTKVIGLFEDDMDMMRDDDDLHWEKLCSALVEAHRHKFLR